MKVITEALIRLELKDTQPEMYYIPEGKILSPAAREYLQQQQIGIDFERNKGKKVEASHDDGSHELKKAKQAISTSKPDPSFAADENVGMNKPKYIDYETGAGYFEKPEHMTQLFDNYLVDKNHPRIRYRGKLDRLQSEVVFAQAFIDSTEKNQKIIDDLGDILNILRELMRCEVLDEKFTVESIIGLSHEELREQSHAPMKFFKVEYMKLPDYTMGTTYNLLNRLRAEVRETEVVATDAFKDKRKMERSDIIEELNRLSSCLHIMMCRYLAGYYKEN